MLMTRFISTTFAALYAFAVVGSSTSASAAPIYSSTPAITFFARSDLGEGSSLFDDESKRRYIERIDACPDSGRPSGRIPKEVKL